MRICIIDDDPWVLEATALALSVSGHDVSTAPDGTTALEVIARELPDVVVVDLTLGAESGADLAAHIRSGNAFLPIVMTSGLRTLPAGTIGSNAADTFLSKPFTPSALIAAANEAVAVRAALV